MAFFITLSLVVWQGWRGGKFYDNQFVPTRLIAKNSGRRPLPFPLSKVFKKNRQPTSESPAKSKLALSRQDLLILLNHEPVGIRRDPSGEVGSSSACRLPKF